MSRLHGKDVRVYLGEYDRSSDLMEISFDLSGVVHERTTFGDAGVDTYDPGIPGYEVTAGAFYQPQSGGIGRQLESLLSAFVLTIAGGAADAVGDPAWTFNPVLTKVGTPAEIGNLVKATATWKGNGSAGVVGHLLHVLGQETITGNGSTVDASAAQVGYVRVNLHAMAVTGTWTITVQDSANDADWAMIGTFTSLSAAGSESLVVQQLYESGSQYEEPGLTYDDARAAIRRYRRVVHTEDVAGSITYAVALAVT